MATTPKRSPTPERTAAEDPDTAAARKELRQTAIAEKPDLPAMAASNHASPSDDAPGPIDAAKDLLASPKKKRAHDEVDEPKDTAAADADRDVSPIGANGSTSLSRTERSEPEKKRPRDVSSELKTYPTIGTAKPSLTSNSKDTTAKAFVAQASSAKSDNSGSDDDGSKDSKSPAESTSTTTTSAFKSSGLSSFASQSSPFLQAGAGQSPLSSFASVSSAQSPFAIAKSATAAPSIFSAGGAGSPFGKLGGLSPSPFGGLSGKPGGTPFGKPGASLASNKPAKPFGAPDSDPDDEYDEEDDNGSGAEGNEGDDDGNQDGGDDGDDGAAAGSAASGEGGKPKPQPVPADDDEASLIQARGKLYSLDKATSTWKERGMGILKLMVPKECVASDGDDPEAGLPGSFDPAALKDSKTKIVRLVMRQEATHRIILNTALLPTMEFREKSGLKATSVLFTAIEDDGPVSITLRMSAAHARRFINDIESVQLQLQSV